MLCANYLLYAKAENVLIKIFVLDKLYSEILDADMVRSPKQCFCHG